jgi:hypothetical protein
MDRKLTVSVRAVLCKAMSNRARLQSSRTAYIAYAGELLRPRQLAVLLYAAEVLLLRFRAVRGIGSDVLCCLVSVRTYIGDEVSALICSVCADATSLTRSIAGSVRRGPAI